MRAYVNGTLGTGNPAAILFSPYDEITVIYGIPHPGEAIPSGYDFRHGD